MAPHIILPRQESAPTISNALAGGLIGGFVVLIVLLCLLCHFCLRRPRVGVDRQGGAKQQTMLEADPALKSMPPNFFSRHRLRASIVLPDKSIPPKPPPHPIQPPSPSSPLSPQHSPQRPLSKISTVSRPRSMSLLNPACSRQSRASFGLSVYDQQPYSPSRLSSRPSSTRSASPTNVARPVRQAFEPALPDELALHRGEYITVLQSFDDGWYLVARDTPQRSSRASRLSAWITRKDPKATTVDAEDLHVGLVPAWVFVKPLRGVTVTRPLRSSSLNVISPDHQALGDGRNAIISWSIFS